MKSMTIPPEQTFLFDLLKMVKEEAIILQTTDGQQFVLVSLADWQGFDIGDSDNFQDEVKRTSENEALIAFLATRKSYGKRVGIEDVKKQLGVV